MIVKSKDMCTGCYACVSSCPNNCISMFRDEEGFLYPEIDKTKCIECRACENACPIINGTKQNIQSMKLGYAAYCSDEDIRKESSSGGIFSLLSEQIIRDGGVVAGVSMTKDFKEAHHIIIRSTEELSLLRGSKYLQSNMEDILSKTKNELEKGHKVLFSGTPCQISGLLKYLGKEYMNLYTQDLICHGVPSPKIWGKYVRYRERKGGSSVKKVLFRYKKFSWKCYAMYFQFLNNKEYIKRFYQDDYMKLFLDDAILRPSCYKCIFRTENRQSDITLADFWGIQHTNNLMDDDKGISFVWIHSERGAELFEQIKPNIIVQKVMVDDALKYNVSAIKNCKENRYRDYLLKNFSNYGFERIKRRYAIIQAWEKVKRLYRRLIS